jgi:GT2 family glycosyltransferase
MNDSIDLSVIIPVRHLKRPVNVKRFFMPRYTIREVLRDLHENVKMGFETIVVCNSRERELVDYVSGTEGIDKYCLNSVNAGVARSWNMGAQLAEGRALCFLNDDVSVGLGGMEALFDVLHSAPDIGEVGPTGAAWRGAEHDHFVEADRPEPVDVIAGYCFMLRTDLYHQLGGFDVAYSPAGFEEIDMSYSIRRAGYRCMVVPGLPFHHYHHHGISAQKTTIEYLRTSIDTEVLHRRNKAYFMRKWGIENSGQSSPIPSGAGS